MGITSWKGASLFNVEFVFQLGGGGEGMGHWLGWGVFSKNNRMGGIPPTERITIFIFFWLVTQLNDSALGVLKHHYITKRTLNWQITFNSQFKVLNS